MSVIEEDTLRPFEISPTEIPTEVPSSPSPLQEDSPRPFGMSPTEIPTELPSSSKSPRSADNEEG